MIADIVGNRTLKSQWDETVAFYENQLFLKFISVENEVTCYTYKYFDQKVKQTANAFVDLGVKKGELVALHLHNLPEYLICWLALAQIGAVSVPINEHFRLDESSYIINKCSISHVITSNLLLTMYLDNFENLKLKKIILVRGNSISENVYNLDEKMQYQPTTLKTNVQISSNDIAVILFTSGTTQNPKGAIYTHCNVIYGGVFHASQIGIRVGEVFLTSMPCYHMDFQEMAAAPVICSGATLVMVEHYSSSKFWKQICEHRANFTDTMSIMNRTMLLQPIEEGEKDHCIKAIYFSMGLSVEEKEAFENRFNVRLLNSYGMTETVSAVTCVSLYGNQNWPSVGRPALSYNIKIIDKYGNTLPPNTEGEICVQGVAGRSIILGYYNDSQATRELIDSDNWLHSGDWGYLDEDGWLFFLGRCKNMIKRSGENISCSEVECVLTSHPCIADAAVVGVPDPMRDQAVKAYVQLIENSESISCDNVIEHCKNKLAYFKVPTVVEFVTDFPRTATGKIKKRELLQKENIK